VLRRVVNGALLAEDEEASEGFGNAGLLGLFHGASLELGEGGSVLVGYP
jgi:hypothetical protein